MAFAGLWCAADRRGRFKWEPRRLGVAILPYDKVEFSRVLDALATRGFIVKYQVNDAWFGAIPSFERHQVVNNREKDSELPEPALADDSDATATRAPRVEQACPTPVKRKGREGKGKEGKGTEEGTDVSPEPEEPASAPAPAPLLEFPCVGAEKTWTVSPGKLAEWEAVYPDMNVLAALRRARQWCVDNPARRKTVSGMPRFIHAWLGTAQNNGENRKAGAERAASPSPSRVPRLPTSDELYGQLSQPGEVLETNILCRQ